MSSGEGAAPRPERARRPKDRKQQIRDRAAQLFVTRGFHAVRMDEIAAASSITVRALYRHYANKKDLLAQVVNAGQEKYLQALRESGVASEGPMTGSLGGLLQGLTTAALDTRDLTVLWQREARYLDPEDVSGVRGRLTDMASQIAGRLSREMPALAPANAELRAWAILGLLASPGHHNLTLPRREFEALLVDACHAAVGAPSTGPLAADPAAPPPARMSARRERLLTSAARAFRRSGYAAVGIDDISNDAGIAGPAMYRYFETKGEILTTLFRRLDEWLILETNRALRSSSDASVVLRSLIDGYVRIALMEPDLLATAVTESLHLPEDVAETLTRSRNDRHAEWVNCLLTVRPDLSETKAKVLAEATIGFLDDTVRIPHLTRLDGVAEELAVIASAVLRSSGSTGSREAA